MKQSRILIAFGSIFLFAQFSSQDSNNVSGRERPSINFNGTMVDSSGSTMRVEDITVSGVYRQIAVYAIPPTHDTDPTANTTFLDLSEVNRIEIDSSSAVQNYKERPYFPISVFFKGDDQPHQYIIDMGKQIECSETNPAGPIEKVISFQALKSLKIDGYKAKEKDQENTAAPVEKLNQIKKPECASCATAEAKKQQAPVAPKLLKLQKQSVHKNVNKKNKVLSKAKESLVPDFELPDIHLLSLKQSNIL
jgi:hypothetical protein